MHLTRGWRDRAANAAARREAQANPDDATIEIRTQRARLMQEAEARARETAVREREEREGPFRHATQILADKLGDDLPEVLAVITKAGGLARLVPFLEREAARIIWDRREAERAAEAEQRKSDMTANRGADLADRAARQEKAAAARARY